MRRRDRVLVGAVCGFVAGFVVGVLMISEQPATVSILPVGSPGVAFVLHLVGALTIGAVFGWISPRAERAHAAYASSGLVVGLLWWIVVPLTAVPLLRGGDTMWSLAEASAVFSNLIAAMLIGSIAGLAFALSEPIARRRFGRVAGGRTGWTANARCESDHPRVRVVIVGGGFGGVAVAQRLERHALDGNDLDVTIVSADNYLLFTPMLAEVAASSLEPHHISAPLRAACPRTRFVRARVTDLDLDARVVRVADATQREIGYDHLVLALGSTPAFHGLAGVEQHCFTLKSLSDATKLRNHVISMLERADAETDDVERRCQLTFVVAGGGFAGSEMVAELSDFAYSALRHYPSVPIGEFRFVLIHSRDRILPEIGPELAAYALDNLRSRDIEVILESRVDRVDAQSVVLDDDTVIGTRTVVWTAGNRPNPLVADLPCGTNDAGALIVEPTLLVTGCENVWALGDCAEVPDADGGSCPPTAQHATRQGTTVANNIIAVESGGESEPFVFSSLGTLVALGHRTAVAEIRGRRFSGFLAWFMWRSIYLFKLPTLEKQARVVIDWTADLLFDRDIVLTSDRTDHEPPGGDDAADHNATDGNARIDPHDNDSTDPNQDDGVAGDARRTPTGGRR